MEVFLIYGAAFGIVTALAAGARGRNPFAWLVIGFLTGLFGLVAVLVMRNLNSSN